jgi:PAS domain S-box-containing protein
MFGAMDVIRLELVAVANQALEDAVERRRLLQALHKILDIELAIMLESYREAFVDQVQRIERIEKTQLERQLALSEARYEEIVETAQALITTSDSRRRILLFNGQCERLTGFAREHAAGRDWLEVFVQEADRDTLRARHAEALAGRPTAPYEGPLPQSVVGTARVRWHFTTLPGGPEPVLCAIGIDVTSEHELAVRTRRAERLAALGTMAAGLAHEIRNPLNAAHLQLSLAHRRITDPAEIDGARVALDLAASEMKRLAVLVEDFLQFARPQPLRLTRGDLRSTAEATMALVAPESLALGVELELLPGESVTLELDDEKMKQVVLNLVRNAIEAAGRGGRVTVTLSAKNDIAQLAVEDDGQGFPAAAPLFEPFFTTKEGGTGLGLAIVHRIVSDHGGTVDIKSRVGRTVVSVSLPISR